MPERLSTTVKMLQESPCTFCKFSSDCENKNCPRWRKWFLQEWKKFNNYYNKYKDNKESKNE